jgi:hypothetical protein
LFRLHDFWRVWQDDRHRRWPFFNTQPPSRSSSDGLSAFCPRSSPDERICPGDGQS